AVIVGHAVSLAWRYRRRPLVRYALPAVVTMMILDFYPAGTLAVTPVSCSPGFSIIRDDPEQDFGILDLPGARPPAYAEGNYYMLQQVCHRRPICLGNVARDTVVTLRDRLETQDLQKQRQQLAESKVKYIVITRRIEGLFPRRDSRLTFQWRASDGRRDDYVKIYPVLY